MEHPELNRGTEVYHLDEYIQKSTIHFPDDAHLLNLAHFFERVGWNFARRTGEDFTRINEQTQK